MEQNLERQLKDIIARSYRNDDGERQMMEKIFSRLARHQTEFLSELSKRIDLETRVVDWERDFDVIVKLVPRGNSEAMRGLTAIDTGTAFFLDAAYDEITNLCAETYTGIITDRDGGRKEFSYRLQRHSRFVRHEKILFDIAALYNINRPVIYSPYARKAVDIIAPELGKDELKRAAAVEFRNDKLIVDHELAWNLSIASATYNRDPMTGADDTLIRYEYDFRFDSDAKAFVLPNQPCDDVYRLVDEDSKTVVLGFNALLKDREYQTVMLNEVEDLRDAFCNDFPRRNRKLRLRTKGDVENVLACFNETRAGRLFPAAYREAVGGNVINLYRREDEYFTPDEERFLGAIKRKPLCRIEFAGGQSKFKADYASFVINYMSKNYPEFNWAGVDS